MRAASKTRLNERDASSERARGALSACAQIADDHVRLKSYLKQKDGDESRHSATTRSNNRKETEMKQRQKLKLL